MWVSMASMNFDKNAAKWLQVYKAQFGLGTWDSFIRAVEEQFGYSDYREALSQLLELKQTGTVEDFVTEFESLQYQVCMHNHGYDEEFFVSQFLKGLKNDIRAAVQIQVPDKMTKAVMLAKIQQKILDRSRTKSQKYTPYNRNSSTNTKQDSKAPTVTSNLWKERQERDYRKAHGLCFYCGDKFDAGHIEKCSRRPKAQVNALVVNDLDSNLTDDILNQLAVEDALTDEFCQLSLNALAGTDSGQAMRIVASVRNKVMLVLVDSGSSHSFVSSQFVQAVGLSTVPVVAKQVKLANGTTLITDKMVPTLEWLSDGHTLVTDMLVLDIPTYDAILGYDWLSTNSPMTCDWAAKTLAFQFQGQLIKLCGLLPPNNQDKGVTSAVQEISMNTLSKWLQGNDVWSLAVVEPVSQELPATYQDTVEQVLQQYHTVFSVPKTLPPSRSHDHHIPLLPNTAPVNSRPYRYSPLHKTEIERQVTELLQASLISHSTSPFASPVLLVQKKDGSWSFCVDYRKLNAVTVKNRFPMPVIEEILEELAGSKYFTKLI